MKVFVFYGVVRRPYGGANQFMRAFKHFCVEQGKLTWNVFKADVLLFNSHSLGGRFSKFFPIGYLMRVLLPAKVFIHRVDGPIQLYGGPDRASLDSEIHLFNKLVVDGTIFQSEWSQKHSHALGMATNRFEAVIHNTADSNYFFPPIRWKSHDHIRLIAISWSDHPNKGFDVYEKMDQNLDWNRFSMTFVGRTSRSFQNIQVIDPVLPRQVGELLRAHDIYITSSTNDPCSNSLLEALACGLPVVARNSGGHPEIIGRGGELFDDVEGAMAVIDRVANNLSAYRQLISVESMDEVGQRYIQFFEQLRQRIECRQYSVKRPSVFLAIRQAIRTW